MQLYLRRKKTVWNAIVLVPSQEAFEHLDPWGYKSRDLLWNNEEINQQWCFNVRVLLVNQHGMLRRQFMERLFNNDNAKRKADANKQSQKVNKIKYDMNQQFLVSHGWGTSSRNIINLEAKSAVSCKLSLQLIPGVVIINHP